MPRHVRFPRSNVSGNIPQQLEPGSPAFNWPDQKTYVGGPGGAPVLVGMPVRDWKSQNTYYLQDVVYRDGYLWRANVSIVPPGNFNPAQWVRLGPDEVDPSRELMGTVVLTPSTIGETPTLVTVSAGSGYVMDVSNPASPVATAVSWQERTFSKSSLDVNQLLYIGVNAGGTVQLFTPDEITPAWRRQNILLGHFALRTDDRSLIDPITRSFPGHNTRSDLTDLLETIGAFRLTGTELTVLGSNQFGVTGGLVWSHRGAFPGGQANIHQVASGGPLLVRMAKREGLGSDDAELVSDPSLYDNAGILIAVPAGQVTIQYAFLKPDGGLIICYGQTVYTDVNQALGQVRDDINGFVFSDVIAPEYVLLGAIVTNDTGSEQIIVPSSLGIAGSRISGPGGGLSTISFLPIDGSQAMQGALDLGGNALINGTIPGDIVDFLVRAYTTTGDTEDDAGVLAVNLTDSKVLVGDQTVADRVLPYDTARIYKLDDLAIVDQTLFRCIAITSTPGPFAPADWEQVGANPLDPSTGAILVEPPNDTRNTIDLTPAAGFAKALSIQTDALQTVDIADFGPRAGIDRYGVPKGAFGGEIVVSTQLAHGFTAASVGLAVYQAPDNRYLLADLSNPDTFPTGVIREVVNENVFLVQHTGIVPNLATESFQGNVAPTRNKLYVLSATPGVLKEFTDPATDGPPVMMALGPTTGVLRFGFQVEITQLTLQDVYPVGSIYLSLSPTLPAAFTANMTWEPYAQGRALVGVGNNGQFDWQVGQERGAETVTLTEAQMPTHNHSVDPPTATTSTAGSHKHGGDNILSRSQGGQGVDLNGASTCNTVDISAAMANAGNHSHTVNIPAFNSGNKGGGQAHNNVQPSIGIHVFRRIA